LLVAAPRAHRPVLLMSDQDAVVSPHAQKEVPRRKRRRCLKGCLLRALRHLPRVPAPVFDAYVSCFIGRAQSGEHFVDFVTTPGSAGAEVQRLPLGSLPPQSEGTVRVVIISDTHERHRDVVVPPGDVLLHCGDILMSSSLSSQRRGLRVLQDFDSWLATTPCRERVVIGGNHDIALERLGNGGAESVLTAATVLQDSSIILPVASLKVYGNAYSEGHSHNRAWQAASPSVSPAACADADIVMSHLCCDALTEAVFATSRPRLWASGHAHAQHGAFAHEGTLFVNASIHDHRYRPVQPPVVVDLPRHGQGL